MDLSRDTSRQNYFFLSIASVFLDASLIVHIVLYYQHVFNMSSPQGGALLDDENPTVFIFESQHVAWYLVNAPLCSLNC